MYITSLDISNLRSFKKEHVTFCHPGCEPAPELPNVTLLLGNNGAGKSTLLRAVALATISPVLESSGFVPHRLVRQARGRTAAAADLNAEVILHAQDTGAKDRSFQSKAVVSTRIERRGDFEAVRSAELPSPEWEDIYRDQSPSFLVVGYGASRRVESSTTFDSSLRARSRQLRYQRVSGLFEEHVTLTPLAAWLPEFSRQNAGRYRQVVNLLNRLLPDGTRLMEEMEDGEYLFSHGSARVPFGALSDGYRAFVGWVADLLYHLCMRAPGSYKLVESRGIVLVDEIDLHLHPEWQRVVVPQLARELPNLQFILSTHSPIVAGTLQAANIRAIQPGAGGASQVHRFDERIHGLNADQILLSSYFGLSSTRAPDAVNTLRRLSRKAQSGDEDAVLAFLQQLSQDTFTDEERAEMDRATPSSGATRRVK